MKKKYFILALTFLCLLMGQSSFGQNVNSDYDEDDICTNETTYFDYSQDCLDVYINVVESYYCKGGVHIDTYSYPSYVSKECDTDSGDCRDPFSSAYPCEYIDLGDCTDSRSYAYPCYVDTGDCTDWRSYAYPCYTDLGDCTDYQSYAYPCVNNDPPSCNESSTPKPSGYIASQYHFVQNSDTDCQWVPYCDPTMYWYELGICKKKYTLDGLSVRDNLGRIAYAGQTISMVDDYTTVSASAITSIGANNNTADFGGLKWYDGFGVNKPDRDFSPSSTTTIVASGGIPNSVSKSVNVEIVPLERRTFGFNVDFSNLFNLINEVTNNKNPFSLSGSLSRELKNVRDKNSLGIAEYERTIGTLSFLASTGDIIPNPFYYGIELVLDLELSGGGSASLEYIKDPSVSSYGVSIGMLSLEASGSLSVGLGLGKEKVCNLEVVGNYNAKISVSGDLSYSDQSIYSTGSISYSGQPSFQINLHILEAFTCTIYNEEFMDPIFNCDSTSPCIKPFYNLKLN